jgi:hypothetical protein
MRIIARRGVEVKVESILGGEQFHRVGPAAKDSPNVETEE